MGGAWSQYGNASASAEVWSPDGVSCSLPLPQFLYSPSVELAGGIITVCYERKCWLLGKSSWLTGPATLQDRTFHTSAVLPGGGVLLVGGSDSFKWMDSLLGTTTEIIQPNNPSVAGFSIAPGRVAHCSIQIGVTSIVLTGGSGTDMAGFSIEAKFALVQEYSNIDQGDIATSKDLPDLNQGRSHHACGMYTVGDSKVIIVAGGYSGYSPESSGHLDTTETLDLSSNAAKWILRKGKLPSSRYGAHGATLGNVFYVFGGSNSSSILAWTDATEDWTQAGSMTTARDHPAVASIPNWASSAVHEWCG